ncbi:MULTISPECIES: phosphatase PAP2 family protein [unclassified Sphingomonas]|uniref:phosphatase PAP2 family protein n=1 Tax=unclassified Sphingomonas TaxID=196159 RepID=UPI0006FBAD5F|nr:MULTISPECIES: phosphatase PAP2 family protein [unclassified Sphingomonas]KQX20212.1 PA-phosphatase [Sphingomonas sp. Root1294]KQY67462.1 PA-phosphatase [Sphingomonas sp. Root50]KRB90839.1 PA-phosphatase [Sphingomonas sp. Root720]
MPAGYRPTPLILSGLVLMIAAIALWGLAPSLDLALLAAFRIDAASALLPAIRGATLLGGLALLAPFALVVAGGLALHGDRRRALWLLLTVATGRLAVEAAKLACARGRPPLAGRLDDVSSYSFPSAHATGTLLVWLAIAMLFERRRHLLLPLAFAMAAMIGWTRLALGVHWPGDVIGGFGLALVWAGLAERWLPPPRPSLSRA